MEKKQFRNSFLLLFTAFVWGMGFVSQSAGGDAIGPFAFNGIRNIMGSAALLPVIAFRDKKGLSRKPVNKEQKNIQIKAGIFCGIALFIASSCQQLGITMGTPTGKAGFLTACYILMVPVFGLFLKKHCSWNIWAGVGLILVGVYLLCMNGGFTVQTSDLLILFCAAGFAVQIMIIDHYGANVDGVRLAATQFFITGVLSIGPAIIIDILGNAGGMMAWISLMCTKEAVIAILYAGLGSTAIGYTLQIIGQEGVNPTIASMLMSFESVFSVLGGFVLLHQILSTRELIGCLIMFVAVILAQLPVAQGHTS